MKFHDFETAFRFGKYEGKVARENLVFGHNYLLRNLFTHTRTLGTK